MFFFHILYSSLIRLSFVWRGGGGAPFSVNPLSADGALELSAGVARLATDDGNSGADSRDSSASMSYPWLDSSTPFCNKTINEHVEQTLQLELTYL